MDYVDRSKERLKEPASRRRERETAEQLFAAALELAPEERAEFLKRACRDTPDLEPIVREMLDREERMGSFLEQPLFEARTAQFAPCEDAIARGATGPRWKVGDVLNDRFVIVRYIARGGMGEVYEVEDRRLQGVHVGLKTLLSQSEEDPAMQKRFEREILHAREVAHPNLCPIYDIYQTDERGRSITFLTMKLLSGETLASRIAKQGPIDLPEGTAIIRQVGDALAALHDAGILHRDIKASNIMLDGHGAGVRVCLMDFGLAHAYQAGAPMLSTIGLAGTPAYMAPELFRGEQPSTSTDVFAIGVVAYEMLIGHVPRFTPGNELETGSDVAFDKLPAEWKTFIRGCVEPDSKRRFASVRVALAVLQLRKVLDDSSAQDQSQYIETISKRGYRFIAPVTELVPQTNQSGGTSQIGPKISGSHISDIKPWLWILVAVAVVLAIAAGALRFLMPRRAVLTEKDTVVLADFANSTPDPVFDGTLRQGMEVQLEQSPFLSLVSEQRIRRTLALMGQPAPARLAGETAREVCQRTGAAVVLEGSIAPLGGDYVLGLRARNCRTGGILDEEQEQVAQKEDVLTALTHIASRFRSRIGESHTTIQEYSTPLAEATTPSLEALKAYSAGWQIHAAHGASAALPFFQRATEIDPQFAMAHASLGRMYADLDQYGLAAASMNRAWQLRERASDREKFFITSNYEILGTGNLEAAQQTCEAWARAYPRESLPHNALAGVVHKTPGRYEKALAETRKAIELDPYFWVGYYSLGVLNVYLGRLQEGESALRAATARGLDADEFIMLAYDIDFLKDDRAGMEREAARARARPGGENWMSAREAFVAAYSGHLQNARTISRRAMAQAQQAGQPERGALWAAGAAIREALFGNGQAATEWAHSALELSNNREVEYGAALAFAMAGGSSPAQALADQMEKQFPEDSAVRFNYLPTLRALLALNRAEPQQAMELLQVASPHELGVPFSAISGLFGALYPVYARGLAYLAANKPAEAAAEFQKILDHRGIVVDDPIGAMAHLQLGRASRMAGDKAKAKSSYEDFLTLWKDADPDIPILKQAKAEYAKLQ